MTKILTHDELIAALQSLQDAAIPALVAGMEVAAAVVEGEAKKNCTLGQSPYEDMVFPTKMEKYQRAGKFKKVKMTSRPSVFVAYEGAYSGAPYSIDQDPARALIHMRDTIYSGADCQNGVRTGHTPDSDDCRPNRAICLKPWGRLYSPSN